MKLSPLEIKKQEFAKAFRGYDVEEVQAFLQMMSSQWETLLEENRRLKEEVRDYQNKIEHYEKVEEALQNALESARQTAKEKVENAEQKAENMIQEAEQKAEKIREDAQQERYAMKRDVSKLKHRREEIVARLRAFLMSEMEMLAQYEEEDPIGFIKFLPQGDEEGDLDEERLQEVMESMPRPKELGGRTESSPQESAEPSHDPEEPSAGIEESPGGGQAAETERGAESSTTESPGGEDDHQSSAAEPTGEGTPQDTGEETSPEKKSRWRVHSVVSSPPDAEKSAGRSEEEEGRGESTEPVPEPEQSQQQSQQEEEGESSEEMEKIRRILDDLE